MSILNTTTFRVDRPPKKHGTADIAIENQYTVPSRGFQRDEDRKKQAADEQRKGKKVQK